MGTAVAHQPLPAYDAFAARGSVPGVVRRQLLRQWLRTAAPAAGLAAAVVAGTVLASAALTVGATERALGSGWVDAAPRARALHADYAGAPQTIQAIQFDVAGRPAPATRLRIRWESTALPPPDPVLEARRSAPSGASIPVHQQVASTPDG